MASLCHNELRTNLSKKNSLKVIIQIYISRKCLSKCVSKLPCFRPQCVKADLDALKCTRLTLARVSSCLSVFFWNSLHMHWQLFTAMTSLGHHCLSNHWELSSLFNRLIRLTTTKIKALHTCPLWGEPHWWLVDYPSIGPIIWIVFPCPDIVMLHVQNSWVIAWMTCKLQYTLVSFQKNNLNMWNYYLALRETTTVAKKCAGQMNHVHELIKTFLTQSFFYCIIHWFVLHSCLFSLKHSGFGQRKKAMASVGPQLVPL